MEAWAWAWAKIIGLIPLLNRFRYVRSPLKVKVESTALLAHSSFNVRPADMAPVAFALLIKIKYHSTVFCSFLTFESLTVDNELVKHWNLKKKRKRDREQLKIEIYFWTMFVFWPIQNPPFKKPTNFNK